jgi:hypothetical protein
MFVNGLNIVRAQSGPIGRIIACYKKPFPIEQFPTVQIRCFILPEIPAAMVSQVGAKSLEICPDQWCASTSAIWILSGDYRVPHTIATFQRGKTAKRLRHGKEHGEHGKKRFRVLPVFFRGGAGGCRSESRAMHLSPAV